MPNLNGWDDVTLADNTRVLYSPFELPTSYRLEIKLKNTSGIRFYKSDKTHMHPNNRLPLWEYGWFVMSSNKRLWYTTGYLQESYYDASYTIDTTSVYVLELDGTSLKTYKDSTVLSNVTCTDPYTLTNLIRVNYSDKDNIDWLKIKAL